MVTRPAETVPAEGCATTPPVPALASPASTAPSASTRPRFTKRCKFGGEKLIVSNCSLNAVRRGHISNLYGQYGKDCVNDICDYLWFILLKAK